MSQSVPRSFTVDVLKVVAAQLIVWHHLSAYGPMSDALQLAWPTLVTHIYHDARLAVQVFLVIGGFLAARTLGAKTLSHPLQTFARRYLRLAPPYLLAVAAISVTVAVARPMIDANWLPAAPSAGQFMAHALLLNALLDIPSLSSGVWYAAIDFQLYVLFGFLVFGLQKLGAKALSIGVALVCTSSLLWFNRAEHYDNWAIYFFGAYGLGILAAWAKRSRFDGYLFALMAVVTVLALWLELRTRIALALLTAVILAVRPQVARLQWSWAIKSVHRFSDSAYALFLTHFGVIVLFSAVWNRLHLSGAVAAMGVMLLAWWSSVGVGLLFHSHAEVPLNRWLARQSKAMYDTAMLALPWAAWRHQRR
jgi:peptidoglycan/LPS O-acetylase OafA/YrhL